MRIHFALGVLLLFPFIYSNSEKCLDPYYNDEFITFTEVAGVKYYKTDPFHAFLVNGRISNILKNECLDTKINLDDYTFEICPNPLFGEFVETCVDAENFECTIKCKLPYVLKPGTTKKTCAELAEFSDYCYIEPNSVEFILPLTIVVILTVAFSAVFITFLIKLFK